LKPTHFDLFLICPASAILRFWQQNRCPDISGDVAGMAVKKFLILFFMGFFVGNAFAEEQQGLGDGYAARDKEAAHVPKPPGEAAPARPENPERNTAKYIDIRVPDAAGTDKARVVEVLTSRGQWVQAGAEVAILAVGGREIPVTSPNTGVIIKAPVSQGDSVSRGATLVQLRKVDIQRPGFRLSWKLFSLVNVNVASVGKRIGGKVKQNIDIPEKEKGKWLNACTIRMSLILNHTGFPIKPGKYSTVSGETGGFYIYRVDEMISYLRDVFGEPDIVVNRVPYPNDFSSMKGILVVTGDGRDDAKGHVTLWDGSACADICHLAGDPKNVNFKPIKAALWVLP
jgi:biotin carboxyl carrier protein